MTSLSWDTLLVPLVIAFNIVCSLGVIFVNKYLFTTLDFHYIGLLTGLHFVATSTLSWGLITAGQEEKNELEWSKTAVLATVTCLSIWFANLSLQLNSVGFYQIAKLSVIPATLLLQFVLYRINVSLATKGALAVLTMGIGIATVTQVDLRPLGFGIASVSVVLTSLQQIVYSTMMKDKKLSGTQLYYNIGPLSALMMFVGGYVVDRASNGGVDFIDANYDMNQLIWVGVSCLLAAPMNFSSAMLLAKTSAITFQVLGHVKTILVFLIGFTFFHSPLTFDNLAGIAVAMVGVTWYSKIQLDKT